MLLLAGMMAVGCAALAVGLGGLLSQIGPVRVGRALSERRAMTFTPYLPVGAWSDVGEDTVQYLVEMIDRRDAYTAVEHEARTADAGLPGGHAAIVLFGEVVSDFYPELRPAKPMPLPFALRGARLAGENLPYVSLAGESIPVVQLLPDGATFYELRGRTMPLDDRVVIRAPARMLRLLDRAGRQQALYRAVLLAPTNEVVDAYVSGSAQGGLFLIPNDVAGQRPQWVRDYLLTYSIYIVAMLGFLSLVLAAFASSARVTVRRAMGTYKVAEPHHGSARQIGLRIAGFVAAVLLLLPVALLLLLTSMGRAYGATAPWVPGVPWVLSAVLLVCAGMWYALVRDALRQSQGGRAA
jgi:hypothetical protein